MDENKEYIIKLKKTAGEGGWHAMVLTAGYGAKVKEAFATTIEETLVRLAGKL